MFNSFLRQFIFVICGFAFLLNVNADDSFFDDDIVFDESEGEFDEDVFNDPNAAKDLEDYHKSIK